VLAIEDFDCSVSARSDALAAESLLA